MSNAIYPIVDPEALVPLDKQGELVRCNGCKTSPEFVEDSKTFYVMCDCEAASIDKAGLSQHPSISRNFVKIFLVDRWIKQINGIMDGGKVVTDGAAYN